MPTLQKLDPDNLRETLVELRYDAIYDFSILKGLIYRAFQDKAQSNHVLKSMSVQFTGGGEPMKVGLPDVLDFTKDSIKFSFVEGRIHFNKVGAYPGWKVYRETIRWVIEELGKLEVLSSVSRIGLRYISDHPEKRLAEIAHVTTQIPSVVGDQITQSVLQVTAREESYATTLTLAETMQTNDSGVFPQATVDIDVSRQFFHAETKLSECLSVIELVHDRQKAAFVNLMQDDYLTSLNAKFSK